MSFTDPTAAGLPTTTAEQLPDDAGTLKRMVLELLASLHERQRDNEALQHRIDLLLRRLYGPRGERVDPNQPPLFPELAAGQDTAASAEPAAKSPSQRRCKPHGRRRLPDNLPREPWHHELAEAERVCPGCGHVRIDIGADRSEQLDYRPASLFVIEHFVHKYACPCCSQRPAHAPERQRQPGQESQPMPSPPQQSQPASAADPAPGQTTPHSGPLSPDPGPPAPPQPVPVVIAAPRPATPIAKGMPGPGLLAHLIVGKYTDHMPLHRQQRAYERQGLFLHRSTLCDWLGSCADLLRPLYDLLVCAVLQS
jgi:transposase